MVKPLDSRFQVLKRSSNSAEPSNLDCIDIVCKAQQNQKHCINCAMRPSNCLKTEVSVTLCFHPCSTCYTVMLKNIDKYR